MLKMVPSRGPPLAHMPKGPKPGSIRDTWDSRPLPRITANVSTSHSQRDAAGPSRLPHYL